MYKNQGEGLGRSHSGCFKTISFSKKQDKKRLQLVKSKAAIQTKFQENKRSLLLKNGEGL